MFLNVLVERIVDVTSHSRMSKRKRRNSRRRKSSSSSKRECWSTCGSYRPCVEN